MVCEIWMCTVLLESTVTQAPEGWKLGALVIMCALHEYVPGSNGIPKVLYVGSESFRQEGAVSLLLLPRLVRSLVTDLFSLGTD